MWKLRINKCQKSKEAFFLNRTKKVSKTNKLEWREYFSCLLFDMLYLSWGLSEIASLSSQGRGRLHLYTLPRPHKRDSAVYFFFLLYFRKLDILRECLLFVSTIIVLRLPEYLNLFAVACSSSIIRFSFNVNASYIKHFDLQSTVYAGSLFASL